MSTVSEAVQAELDLIEPGIKLDLGIRVWHDPNVCGFCRSSLSGRRVEAPQWQLNFCSCGCAEAHRKWLSSR